MVNRTTEKWTRHDYEILENTKTRCVKFYKKSPCVKVFVKTAYHTYRVVCGAEE
jgi:hypothetical protein